MLDARAQHLLKTLVERYIVEGEPVGSRALSKYSGLDLSAATVRNCASAAGYSRRPKVASR